MVGWGFNTVEFFVSDTMIWLQAIGESVQKTYAPMWDESGLQGQQVLKNYLFSGASDEMIHLACVSRFISRGWFLYHGACFSF